MNTTVIKFNTLPNAIRPTAEHHDFLVERIKGAWELKLGSNGGKSLKGQKLGGFLDRVETFRDDMARLVSRGYPEDALRPDGALLLHRMGAVAISGLDTYTQPDAGVSFRAASVDTPTTPL